MTQDEKWFVRYNDVREFIETNHRNPSKHQIEEHDMLIALRGYVISFGVYVFYKDFF